jgi:hypothetical protein
MLPFSFVSAQGPESTCGNEQLPPFTISSIESSTTGCFDVDEVFENCTPIFIRVNVHLFTDDACTGGVQITNGTQLDAYAIAEGLINNANGALADNQRQWVVGSDIPCVPFRYVLTGVYIHCKSNAIGGGNTAVLNSTYGVNPQSEVNVFIANFPGSSTGIGLWSIPKCASIDWITTGNFNHEMGHVFSLNHSWGLDGCADTPDNLIFNWDLNCDGTLTSSESNRQCWNWINPDESLVLLSTDNCPSNSDKDLNKNGIHDCKETQGIVECENPSNNYMNCSDRPCCDWAMINNNMMAYNAFQNAITECQIRRMLDNMSNNTSMQAGCGYVDYDGGCAPPSAFITQMPKDLVNTTDCNVCIIMEASFNEVRYNFRVIEVPTGIIMRSSGWKNGQVPNYCFDVGNPSGASRPPLYRPNTQYRVELTVESACQEQDFDEYVFTTPPVECKGTPIDDPICCDRMSVSPNPTTGVGVLTYTASADEKVTIYAVNSITTESSTLVSDLISVEGENQVELNMSNLQPGMHHLILISDYQYSFVNITKL